MIVGGSKADAYLRKLADRVADPATLRVGFFPQAEYPDGTKVALVAAIQNFGAPARGIPPRPFFTHMVDGKSDAWGPALGRLLQSNGFHAKPALELMGEHLKGDLQISIQETNSPPLSPVTIERKGFEKPLIDSGRMFQSVGWEVGAP